MQTQFELFPNVPTVKNPGTYWARYRAYLRSASWQIIAEETKRLADYKCRRCGRSVGLQCHHRTYLNVFRERPGIDTMCVCGDCHQYIHAHPLIAANDNSPAPARRTA